MNPAPIFHAAFPLDHLVDNPDSPRQIDNAGKAALAASLDRHGYVGVIVVRLIPTAPGMPLRYRIIAGAQCVADLRRRGVTTAPVYIVDCSDLDEHHLAITLNGHHGRWDLAKLGVWLKELNDANERLTALGIQSPDVDRLLRELADQPGDGHTHPDDIPPVPSAATSRRGEIWQLGAHRLVIGDASDDDAWSELLGDDLVDLVVTDPPYGVDYQGEAGAVLNDNLSESGLADLIFGSLRAAQTHAKPGAPLYCAHADTVGPIFRSAAIHAGWKMSQTIIWAKDSFVLGRADYQWRHEPILYGWKPGAAHVWHGGRKQSSTWEQSGITITPGADGKTNLCISAPDGTVLIQATDCQVLADDRQCSMWHIKRPRRSADHPTMKPVELIERMLTNSSDPGAIVADCFGGSGTTLIAAERLGRRARLLELDPRYADVIITRWEKFTGLKAEKVKS